MKAIICTVIAGLAFAAPLRLDAQVKLGAYLIPGVVEVDKSGVYDKILARVSEVTGLQIKYTAMPASRLEDQFKKGEFDAIFPIDARFWDEGGKLNSEPVNIAKIYIFTKDGVGPYSDLDSLKGKKVGVRSGLPYGPKMKNADVRIKEVAEDNQNVEKLSRGRIDAFLAYVPDMWFWAAEKKQPLPNHDAARPFDTHKDAFLYTDGPATREFIAKFNDGIAKLRSSGELKTLLGEGYVP